MRISGLVVLLTFSLAAWSFAQSATEPTSAPSAESTQDNSPPPHDESAKSEDKLSVTQHSITLDGNKIDYQATAGTLNMKDEQGKPLASFFFVAYTKQPTTQPADRPVTFVFNGGPGAAAVWLHMGCIGPEKVNLQEHGLPYPPPHVAITNDQCWLDLTDLVFIDPVGTGYSRPAEGRKDEEFHGVEQDLDTVGNFIRLYLTRYQRWESPKFLAGESYGTTRAAGLSSHLLENYGIDLNGIVLISTVLNFQTLSPSDGNDLPYALYLPTYASLALYHQKATAPDHDQFVEAAAHYAMNDYIFALSKGGNLTKEARAAVVDQLAKYTGISPALIDQANLRIGPTFFRRHLLEDQRLIIGRYDGRITGEDPSPESFDDEYDPSYSLYLPVYSAVFNDYVRRELKFESDLKYEVLANLNWDFGQRDMGYLDMTESLRSAMLQNPNLKVLVCSGYDDLATPFQATRYTFDHLDPTDLLHARVTQTYYPSGHMIYHDGPSLKKLKQDVTAFFAAALKG
ncbi:MAG: peptidase S10 [Tepidisphaeraceae bacterium]|jgi:carboxypeptidase C (cathepsin A)